MPMTKEALKMRTAIRTALLIVDPGCCSAHKL